MTKRRLKGRCEIATTSSLKDFVDIVGNFKEHRCKNEGDLYHICYKQQDLEFDMYRCKLHKPHPKYSKKIT